MAEKDMFPLNPTLMRGLNDKLYEKRKIAALEIERWVNVSKLAQYLRKNSLTNEWNQDLKTSALCFLL